MRANLSIGCCASTAQQWHNLSDFGAEEVLYVIQSMQAFAGLDLETTILNFRHPIFTAIAEHLAAKSSFAAARSWTRR